MDYKALAKKTAELGLPVLGAALGGPSGALIGKALASAIGASSDAPEDLLNEITVNEQARADAFRFQAENELELKRLSVEEKRIDMEDRNSARGRESVVKDNTNKVLAYSVVGSFITIVGATLAGWTQVDSVLAGTLIGYLSAKAEQVIAYYFGSSSGSKEKTELLSRK